MHPRLQQCLCQPVIKVPVTGCAIKALTNSSRSGVGHVDVSDDRFMTSSCMLCAIDCETGAALPDLTHSDSPNHGRAAERKQLGRTQSDDKSHQLPQGERAAGLNEMLVGEISPPPGHTRRYTSQESRHPCPQQSACSISRGDRRRTAWN